MEVTLCSSRKGGEDLTHDCEALLASLSFCLYETPIVGGARPDAFDDTNAHAKRTKADTKKDIPAESCPINLAIVNPCESPVAK